MRRQKNENGIHIKVKRKSNEDCTEALMAENFYYQCIIGNLHKKIKTSFCKGALTSAIIFGIFWIIEIWIR